MTISSGSSSVRTGLVFHYDMDNLYKSWRGKPITNLVTDTPSQNGWAGQYILINSSQKIFEVQVRQDNAATPSAWRTHYWSVAGYAGQTVTISMDVELLSETNCVWSRTAVGQGNTGAYPYHIAGSDAADKMQLTNFPSKKTHFTWTGVINATEVVGISTWIADVTASGANAWLRISNVMIEANDHETRFVNGTRSNTQALVDLTGNNTITANSLVYNSDNTFEFNGSSTYASVGNLGNFSEITVELWFNYDAITNYRNPIDCNYTTGGSGTGNIGPRMECNSSGNVSWMWSANTTTNNTYSGLIAQYGISTGNWYHSVFSWKNSSTYAAYINGVNNGYSPSHNGGNNGAWMNSVSDLVIGRGFTLDSLTNRSMDGKIGSVKIYNRALNAEEVIQNFEASRGRYGV